MLKFGTYAEFDDIKRMALSFFYASPYKDQYIDERRVEELIQTFLSAPKQDKLLIVLVVDEQPVGILAAMAEQNLFNYSRFAGELIWWIEPAYRKGRYAEEMRKAFEYWAKTVGCETATLVDVMGNLNTYYTRKGYEGTETTYLKRL